MIKNCDYDGLTIYDGNSTSSSLINTYCGSILSEAPGTIIASGTCLHFVFYSDGSETRRGWEASISCAAPCDLTNCTLDCDSDGILNCADCAPDNAAVGSDTDNDGVLDGAEVLDGSNPLDICDPNTTFEICIIGIHIPTGFSPNGDGNNDIYSIIVGQDIQSMTMSIYDRWGNLMVKSSEFDFAASLLLLQPK